MNGSLSHFRATRQRRQERLDTNAHKFVQKKEKFTTTGGHFDFPKLKKDAQRELQTNIKKRLAKEQKSRNIKALLLSLIFISLVIATWKYL